MARKNITKKIRFEVFKRDSFTCQYCGRMSPDIILEIDHINPVVNGGDNDMMNLITSCFDCNRGKGKRKLNDKDEIKKQQAQLKELNTKREQLKMLLEWRNELQDFEKEQVQIVEEAFEEKLNSSFTDIGREKVKKMIHEFGLVEVLECLDISYRQYYSSKHDNTNKIFDYIGRIANTRRNNKSNPLSYKKNYIRGILRNRMYVNESVLNRMLKVIETEKECDEVEFLAKNCKHWTDFKNSFETLWEYD